ncbi:LTA synthase family protein [Allofrancisella inopinata]|nr:LTA synthase family protein [Allofrancisella inopinata]
MNNWLMNILIFFLLNIIIFFLTKKTEQHSFDSCIKSFGVLMTILIYLYRNQKQIETLKSSELEADLLPKRIIAIQSESYMLAKENFDFSMSKKENCYKYGKLHVPCYGAYTMRSEFAFLTGLSLEKLDTDSFNPYRKTYKSVTNSYIEQLKGLGYRCVVVHPFKKDFFNRKQVFEHLGFDDFIDESEFEKTDIFTTDAQLTEYLEKYLQKHSDQKIFIFVITIAGHGPYTLQRRDSKKYKANTGSDEVDSYLDLNYKATTMLKALENNIDNDTLLIWYGDHKPSIANWNLSQQDKYSTDYFIIKKNASTKYSYEKNINVENLLSYSIKDY